MDLLSLLHQVKTFKFSSSSKGKSQTGWNGYGEGLVVAKYESDKVIFKEEGLFKLESAQQSIKVTNEYIWQKNQQDRISLSHARFGYDNLVNLFDLIKISDTVWQSEKAHVCVDDLYSAELEIMSKTLKLKWNIVGPKKDEIVEYIYNIQ